MVRYSVIKNKNPREIVLLIGRGCVWKKCSFCDYHLDCSSDPESNYKLNKNVLSNVKGTYNRLEVINSGSFPELDDLTKNKIVETCMKKQIKTLHTECHYIYRDVIPKLRLVFAEAGIEMKIKTGVETFDYDFRENYLIKGIPEHDPAKIAENFDECCLLFGLTGQKPESMIFDIETGLKYFERVCVNIMTQNTTKILPDSAVIDSFIKYVYPSYVNNKRVDILLNNTDFGVGKYSL